MVVKEVLNFVSGAMFLIILIIPLFFIPNTPVLFWLILIIDYLLLYVITYNILLKEEKENGETS